MRRLGSFLVITLSLTMLSASPTAASKGGIEQTKNTFVVGFTYSNAGVPSLCNGALIEKNVIATARHCVVNKDGVYGIDYVFSEPGAKLDAAIDASKTPTLIKQIIIPQQSPTQGIDQRLDLAFLVTDKPFSSGTPISIATSADIAKLEIDSFVSAYGYGEVFETGATYSSYPRKFQLSWQNRAFVAQSTSLVELLSAESVACKGDSGGPVTTINADGKEVLLGVINSAGEVLKGCGSKLADGFYRVRVSLIASFASQIPKPSITPAPKVRKITCVKGTKKRVITGVNPKCPKGFKIKK